MLTVSVVCVLCFSTAFRVFGGRFHTVDGKRVEVKAAIPRRDFPRHRYQGPRDPYGDGLRPPLPPGDIQVYRPPAGGHGGAYPAYGGAPPTAAVPPPPPAPAASHPPASTPGGADYDRPVKILQRTFLD